MNKREAKLKEKIGRCMASTAISDNVYTNLQAQKIIGEASQELRTIKKEQAQGSEEKSNE